MRRSFLPVLILLVTFSPVKADESCREYVQLILRSADCFISRDESGENGQPDDMNIILDEYMDNCRKLDSLQNVFLPMDTLSGWIGLSRVKEIGSLCNSLGMYKRGRSWWKLLDRTDGKGFFTREIYRGLMRAGVELSDSLLLVEVLNRVELWKSPSRGEISEEIISAIDALHFMGTGPEWLWKKFNRMERFLPRPRSHFLAIRILYRWERWSKVNELCSRIVEKYEYSELTPCQMRQLLEASYKSAFLSGRVSRAEDILEMMMEYGKGEQISRAKLWLTGIHMAKGELDRAAKEFGLLCDEGVEEDITCFWNNYISEYKEIVSGAEQ